MRNLTRVFSLLLLILLSTQYVVADTSVSENESITPVIIEDTENNTTKSINKYFELELFFDSQNPLTKSLQYTLKVTPRIDSTETQITWDLPTVLTAKPKHKEFVSLSKDQTYTYSVSISPLRGGVYDITANVTSWQNEVNYTNSVSKTVTLSKGLVAQPVESSYTISLILFIVVIIAIFGGLVFLVVKLSSRGIEILKKWLTPPF